MARQQKEGHVMASSYNSAKFLIDSRMADAAHGDANALYELGVAYSTGTSGIEVDLVEAHKWFNLAALNGSALGQQCRADISEEMTAREIAEAQRQARAWLSGTSRRAA
jgi:TPR repeat protein